MAFSLLNGLSAAGSAVAATAGAYTLEAQKADLEKEKVVLANQLAGQRESVGRQEQGQINATAAEKEQTFKAGESTLTRASEEKRAKMSTDATLGAASISAAASVTGHNIAADASRDVAKMQGEAHVKASENYAKSRLDVADTNNKTKKEIADQRAATGLTADALDGAAIVYNTTGELPALGFGGASAKQTIINRAAELRAESGTSAQDWMSGAAGSKAAKTAVTALTKQASFMDAFSATAEKNGELVKSLLDKGVGPSGVPVLDRWIQAGRKNIAGDADVSALNAALETFKQEQAKIMSGATGAAGITDAARAHVDEMLSTASTREQFEKVMKVFELERQNRISANTDQIKALEKRAGGGSGAVVPSPAATMAPVPQSIPLKTDGTPNAAGLTPGTVYNTSRGPAKWNGTAFEPVP